MRAVFIGDEERYHLKPGESYRIDFRSDGPLVFVDVGLETSLVHPSLADFLDSWKFIDTDNPVNRVRKHTDLDKTRYFTTGEAAEFLGVSQQTIRNWSNNGTLEYAHLTRKDGHRRFLRSDCVELLNSLREGF